MKKTLLDILACPMDKYSPLEIHEIKMNGDDIAEGVLHCNKCCRFYPIIQGIPILLPDDLRDKKQELEFLEKNKDKLPTKISKSCHPWHL